MSQEFDIAVLGATGAVGEAIVQVLEIVIFLFVIFTC